VAEVVEAEERQTADGTGTRIIAKVRVAQEPFSGQHVFVSYFVATDNDEKAKGAEVGVREYRKLLAACGFLPAMSPKMPEAHKKALKLGMAKELTKDFQPSDLIGKFFIGTFDEDKPNHEGKVFSKMVRAEMIDPDQYQDIISGAKKPAEDAGDNQPPF
jgi:hypothetical protein